MKPILLGMNNPHSADPAHALYPSPEGCSGHRLWKMIYEASAMTRAEYVRLFDRRNLCQGSWNARAAPALGDEFRKSLVPGTRVVVLGQKVWRALGLNMTTVRPRTRVRDSKFSFYYLPHPSGLNQYYNDAMNRWWAGRFLADLVYGDQE